MSWLYELTVALIGDEAVIFVGVVISVNNKNIPGLFIISNSTSEFFKNILNTVAYFSLAFAVMIPFSKT